MQTRISERPPNGTRVTLIACSIAGVYQELIGLTGTVNDPHAMRKTFYFNVDFPGHPQILMQARDDYIVLADHIEGADIVEEEEDF